eukprot:8285700-Alexandrium_andersonii.AAC.1
MRWLKVGALWPIHAQVGTRMLAAGPVLVFAWAACNGQQLPSTLLCATVPCDLGCPKNSCTVVGMLQHRRGRATTTCWAAAELRQQ